MEPRAITGYATASVLGVGREAFAAALASPLVEPPGEEGARAVESFDAAKYPGARVLEVPGFDATRWLGDKGLRVLDRLTKLLVVTARLALVDAGLKKDGAFTALPAERVGVCLSNAYGSLEAMTELDRVAQLEDRRYINPQKFPNTVSNSASGYVSIWEGLRALNVTVSDGNCGALDAFLLADMHLASERADAVLVGGGEAMSEALYLAFQKLGMLGATELGEGVGFVSLEPLDGARARGAAVLAELVGYGTSFAAPRHEAILAHAEPRALASALTLALADAGVTPADVDLVVSGVSGLSAFDSSELTAIAEVLGPVPVAAPKRVLGETLGGGGILGVSAALEWLRGAPPSPLVVGQAKDRVRTVVVTSVGYYGNASAVVLRAAS